MAVLLHDQGKYGEAELLLRGALDGLRGALGPAHPNTLAAQHNLADLLKTQGKLDEAEPLFRDAADGRMRALGEAHLDTRNSLGLLSQVRKALAARNKPRATVSW